MQLPGCRTSFSLETSSNHRARKMRHAVRNSTEQRQVLPPMLVTQVPGVCYITSRLGRDNKPAFSPLKAKMTATTIKAVA